MAPAVQPGIVHTLALGSLMRRDHRFASLGVQVGDEVCPGIAAIRDDAREREAIEERVRLGAVMALSGGQACPQGIA